MIKVECLAVHTMKPSIDKTLGQKGAKKKVRKEMSEDVMTHQAHLEV